MSSTSAVSSKWSVLHLLSRAQGFLLTSDMQGFASCCQSSCPTLPLTLILLQTRHDSLEVKNRMFASHQDTQLHFKT